MRTIVYIFVMLSAAFTAMAQGTPPILGGQGGDAGREGAAPLQSGREGTSRLQSYAWRLMEPLGLHQEASIDTLLYNYYQQAIPSAVSAAYATTGNTASPGLNMIFMQRPQVSDFYFRDALQAWLPSLHTQRFYNTRIPMTLLSYNFGGGRENGQERLNMVFSGNAGPRWQVGALLDYIYSKGSYDYQAAKDLTWGASASYLGDRYEMQAFMYHYNNYDMNNGGITDPLYITDPAQLQGGTSSINPKSIPTNLTKARTRVKGTQIYLNNRYKVGYWHEERDSTDSVVKRVYIPVSSFIHTLDYREAKHRFTNSANEDFWENHYLSTSATNDLTTYWSLRNTLGVSLLEGFNPRFKFGLAAYATYEVRRYNLQPVDTFTIENFPDLRIPSAKATENLLYVGAQLTKQRGAILRYDATAQFGVVGPVAGDIDLRGNVYTNIPLRGDTLKVKVYGAFSNKETPYLLKHYVGNHFIWDSDLGKERRYRVGGTLSYARTGTSLDFALENLQHHVYFGTDGLPVQDGGSVQVLAATLRQDLSWKALHWDNSVTWQTTSDKAVIPLPALAVYSNLYLWFKVARVLQVQFGVDCDYYTKYYAPVYQPSTMAFCNQTGTKVGNYPFCNIYINMKLSKARFYIMWSHVNQGIFGGKSYFSMPGYPLNPRRFQLGVSVDFAD